MSGPAGDPRLTFPASHRLRKQREFDAVYKTRVTRNIGPLRVFGRPNGLTHCRLGLSVSRRVGNAVVRNRLKRMLREAFRLLQHDLPGGYDLVIVARAHEPRALEDYQQMLTEAVRKIERHWTKARP